MGLQDEMTIQRIEVLLDMQAKKVQTEFQRLREELSQVKEDLRKEIKLNAARQDAPAQQYTQQPQWQQPAQQQAPPQFQGQFGAAQAPQWAQAGQGTQFPGQATGAPQQQYVQSSPAQRPTPAAPPAVNHPIDRNGVAPSDVSIEKFFYMGNRK